MKTVIKCLLVTGVLILPACSRFNRDPYADTPTSGIIRIAVDETFKPVAEAEVSVFAGIYRYSDITPLYHPESDCFLLLMDDSVRLAITARTLSPGEKERLWQRKIIARETKIATDGIALIVNRSNMDTVMSMSTFSDIVTGKTGLWSEISPTSKPDSIIVVFDHNRSSLLRYVLDSVAGGKRIKGNLYALDSNLDVVDYVSKHENALGLIGVSWISDQDDPQQLSFLKNVNVVSLSLKEPATSDNSYKPYQAYLFNRSYPLTREVFAINAEPRNGLATGFTSFLASDKGQRIILKSGILPATAPVRVVNVRKEL